jgi:hypothetical protein
LQPKAKENCCIPGYAITRPDRHAPHSSTGMLQFFEPYIWNSVRKTVINAWW